MSSKYKFVNSTGIYFVTVNWVDVFTRNIYRAILVDIQVALQRSQRLGNNILLNTNCFVNSILYFAPNTK